MGPLFAYSILPVLSVAVLLFFTAALRGRNARGLALYCLSVAVWMAALFLLCFPATATLGERMAAVGSFTAAGYLHAAFDVTGQRRYGPVWAAYLIALGITLLGVVQPGILYGPLALQRGPLFWQAMALAVGSATLPLWTLWRAYRTASAEQKRSLRNLAIAGVMAYAGGMGNALLLSSGRVVPIGLYVVLGALLVLANVIRAHQPPSDRRLMERSLLYSALAAFLSAGFLFGVMSWMSNATQPFLSQYRLGAFFLLAMAALAFEPLRQQVQGWLGRLLLRNRADAHDLARVLGEKEERADQASRLAELGQFASAVAHEVRNPLGVLSAHLKVLERKGLDPDSAQAMREQIDRASHFIDELLRYGRPRPLELRFVDLDATVDLAFSTARQGLGAAAPAVELEKVREGQPPLVEADQAQLSQLLVILFENALLALASAAQPRLRVTIRAAGSDVQLVAEDSGPGIPPELAPRLFQPFVTGRKREGPRPGTGLGLAIARGIAERHGGSIRAGRSDELGGARFEVQVPRTQAVLAVASNAARS